MKLGYILALMVVLAGCSYTGEVVSIDTADDSGNNEQIVDDFVNEETPEEQETEEAVYEPEDEGVVQEITYRGKITKKAGLASYTVRLEGSDKEIIVFTREMFYTGDVIEFKLTESNDAYDIILVKKGGQRPLSRYQN